MIAVPDAASIGAMRALSARLGRSVGGSTGTNLVACMTLIEEMAAAGQVGSVVTILCDSGQRYAESLYADAWLAEQGVAWQGEAERYAALLA